jgi:hypothetical protein
MKSSLLAVLFLMAASSVFAGPRISVGIGVGFGAPLYGGGYSDYPPVYIPQPPPPPPVVYAPRAMRSGYTWVEGYWYPMGARYVWRPGYWARPPYEGAYWVAPRYYGHGYYRGYWHRRH